MKKIRIVFDGPPGPESGRFVEVEDESGKSIRLGEWVKEGDFWYLEFPDLKAALAEKEKAHNEEMGRWQQEIYKLVMELSGNYEIDGAGCDSGDPLDFTLSEISQGFNFLKDQFAEAQKEINHWQSVVEEYQNMVAELRQGIASLKVELHALKEQYPAGLSYCPVHRTIGVKIGEDLPCCLIASLKELNAKYIERLHLEEELSETLKVEVDHLKLFNPCNHTGVESASCDICGYPDSRKLIASLKRKLESSDSIREAEKRILIKEIELFTSLKAENAHLKKELEAKYPCDIQEREPNND